MDRLKDGAMTRGTVDVVCGDPADVIPDSDLTLLPLPAFARRTYLEAIAPLARRGSAVGILPGQGGSHWLAKQVFGDREGHSSIPTPEDPFANVPELGTHGKLFLAIS